MKKSLFLLPLLLLILFLSSSEVFAETLSNCPTTGPSGAPVCVTGKHYVGGSCQLDGDITTVINTCVSTTSTIKTYSCASNSCVVTCANGYISCNGVCQTPINPSPACSAGSTANTCNGTCSSVPPQRLIKDANGIFKTEYSNEPVSAAAATFSLSGGASGATYYLGPITGPTTATKFLGYIDIEMEDNVSAGTVPAIYNVSTRLTVSFVTSFTSMYHNFLGDTNVPYSGRSYFKVIKDASANYHLFAVLVPNSNATFHVNSNYNGSIQPVVPSGTIATLATQTAYYATNQAATMTYTAGILTANSLSTASSTMGALGMTGNVDMKNNDVNYVNQLHFNGGVRFYDDVADPTKYLNYKWTNTGAGGIKFIDGDSVLQGYVYASGNNDDFGLLDADGNWAVRINKDSYVDFYVNNVEQAWVGTDGLHVDSISRALNATYVGFSDSIDMNNNDVNYVSQLHFNDNVRFFEDGNNKYLNFKWGNTTNGGIKFLDGNDNLQGYVYSSGDNENFGLLDSDGDWAVRINRDDYVDLYVNNVEQFYVTGTDAYIPSGGLYTQWIHSYGSVYADGDITTPQDITALGEVYGGTVRGGAVTGTSIGRFYINNSATTTLTAKGVAGSLGSTSTSCNTGDIALACLTHTSSGTSAGVGTLIWGMSIYGKTCTVNWVNTQSYAADVGGSVSCFSPNG